MKLEKDLMQQISKRLVAYQFSKQVLWHGRLNSLKVKTIYGGVVQGLPKGTPDWLVLIRNKSKGITVLWIEAKSDSGILRKEQWEFMRKYSKEDDIQFLVLRDIKQLDEYINDISYDFVKDI